MEMQLHLKQILILKVWQLLALLMKLALQQITRPQVLEISQQTLLLLEVVQQVSTTMEVLLVQPLELE